MNDPRDKEQGFSGIKRSAELLTPRKNGPRGGGMVDTEEAVELKPIDESRPWGLNENATPGAVSGYAPSSYRGPGGSIERLDAPYDWPKDLAGTDRPDVITEAHLDYEWGRRPPALPTCTWQERAGNPGYDIEITDPVMPMQHNPGMKATMDEWKAGSLHSGSKTGPVVKNQKQAIAIAMSEKRRGK